MQLPTIEITTQLDVDMATGVVKVGLQAPEWLDAQDREVLSKLLAVFIGQKIERRLNALREEREQAEAEVE